MTKLDSTDRTRIRRKPDRAVYEQAEIYAIIDEAFLASVAVSIDGQPHVQPMLHARDGDALILHGSSKNRLLTYLRDGGEAAISITIADALVLGASVPDHTMNYRSVAIYGKAAEVVGEAAKRAAMEKVFNSLAPKRWNDLPPVDGAYLEKATLVLKIPLSEAVAKINRSAPAAGANPENVWTGLLPSQIIWGPPQFHAVDGGDDPGAPEGLAQYRR